jgi:hypothetical protein
MNTQSVVHIEDNAVVHVEDTVVEHVKDNAVSTDVSDETRFWPNRIYNSATSDNGDNVNSDDTEDSDKDPDPRLESCYDSGYQYYQGYDCYYCDTEHMDQEYPEYDHPEYDHMNHLQDPQYHYQDPQYQDHLLGFLETEHLDQENQEYDRMNHLQDHEYQDHEYQDHEYQDHEYQDHEYQDHEYQDHEYQDHEYQDEISSVKTEINNTVAKLHSTASLNDTSLNTAPVFQFNRKYSNSDGGVNELSMFITVMNVPIESFIDTALTMLDTSHGNNYGSSFISRNCAGATITVGASNMDYTILNNFVETIMNVIIIWITQTELNTIIFDYNSVLTTQIVARKVLKSTRDQLNRAKKTLSAVRDMTVDFETDQSTITGVEAIYAAAMVAEVTASDIYQETINGVKVKYLEWLRLSEKLFSLKTLL